MVKFAGYARRPRSIWLIILLVLPYSLIILGVVSFSGWLLSMNSTQTKNSLPPSTFLVMDRDLSAEVEAKIEIEDIVFARDLDEYNLPKENLIEFSLRDTQTIFAVTKVKCKIIPQQLRHVWINPMGRVVADVKLKISHPLVSIWSYISLDGSKPGKWEFLVQTVDGQAVGRKSFVIY